MWYFTLAAEVEAFVHRLDSFHPELFIKTMHKRLYSLVLADPSLRGEPPRIVILNISAEVSFVSDFNFVGFAHIVRLLKLVNVLALGHRLV